MSPLPYPLETRRFPIDFPLPTATPSTPGGHGRIRNSSSINISFDNGRSSDEDGMDEEDEAFVRDDDDEGKDDRGSDDDDGKDDDEINGALPKTTRLNPQQLAKYAPFFVENEQGTLQPTFSMIYQTNQESWRSICEVINIKYYLLCIFTRNKAFEIKRFPENSSRDANSSSSSN